MAQQLDLQEQEQVDALKAFWAKYGNLIMWSVTLVLVAFAGWSLWMKREQDKANDASTLGALLLAKTQADKGDAVNASANLQWVADNGNDENAAVAHLRLAGLMSDARKYDDALKQLALVKPAAFAALVSDRRGDIELAQGQKDAATKAYKVAYDALPATAQYRLLVDAKLTKLGAAPAASAASGAASGAVQ
jgi:predicted negative regulator of RcsB-dependent stress response